LGIYQISGGVSGGAVSEAISWLFTILGVGNDFISTIFTLLEDVFQENIPIVQRFNLASKLVGAFAAGLTAGGILLSDCSPQLKLATITVNFLPAIFGAGLTLGPLAIFLVISLASILTTAAINSVLKRC